MVGVAGGVPAFNDIRLGDVVVSMPGKHGGGVVKIDVVPQEGLYTHNTSFNLPPPDLLAAIEQRRGNHGFLGHLSEIPPYIANEDQLFRADCNHNNESGALCEYCDDK
jgi:hypothetical protein